LFCYAEAFYLMLSSLSCLVSFSWAIRVLFRNLLYIAIPWSTSSIISSSSFEVSGLIIRYFIHSELIFVQSKTEIYFQPSSYRHSVFPAPLLKEVIFTHCIFCNTFVENQLVIVVWAYFFIIYSISLVYMSGFVSLPCYFSLYVSVVYF
jgi:hypothetical protein